MIGKSEVYFFQSFKVIYSLNKIYKKNIKIGKVSHQKNPDSNKIKETKNYVIIITIKGVMNMEQEDIDIEEYLAKFIKTPEEIEQEKREEKNRLLLKGYLPKNEEYNETPRSPMEMVEQNPQIYIMEECIPACEELWKKNVYTFMVSDYLNEGECWIEVVIDNLSDENKEILFQLSESDIRRRDYHRGCMIFGVNKVGKEGQERLLELAQKFQMQDVPYGEAYYTLPEYLIERGCYKEEPNPDYIEMQAPWIQQSSPDELGARIIAYDEYLASNQSKKTIKVFDSTKVTKPLEDYLSETGAIYEDGRVYLSDYHYQKHQNYVKSLTTSQEHKHTT